MSNDSEVSLQAALTMDWRLTHPMQLDLWVVLQVFAAARDLPGAKRSLTKIQVRHVLTWRIACPSLRRCRLMCQDLGSEV